MGLTEWLRRKSDQRRATSEMVEFLSRIKGADRMALALTSVQAADVAARLYADTNGGIDLRFPRAALAARPTLLYELTEAVIKLQAAGHQREVPGTIMWVCTLRAEMIPALRPLVKELWSLVTKGGWLLAREAVALYENEGRELPDNIIFRAAPEGFDDDNSILSNDLTKT
jgi:hypothetical protein